MFSDLNFFKKFKIFVSFSLVCFALMLFSIFGWLVSFILFCLKQSLTLYPWLEIAQDDLKLRAILLPQAFTSCDYKC